MDTATLTALAGDAALRPIIVHPDDDDRRWQQDLERFLSGDVTLTRQSAGEAAIVAIQRLMIFLGYSTSSSGAFVIDGDFGRGTNRGLAQFQFEHGLAGADIDRATLCYPCQWNTAARLITTIPDARLTSATLQAMLVTARECCTRGEVMTGNVDDAIFHLNALHKRRFLDCRRILDRYGELVVRTCARLRDDEDYRIAPEWVLAIVRQETAGVIRPRFEQHYLSRLNQLHPGERLSSLRMRSMSLGLGQIMGENFRRVGAPNAEALFTAPSAEQLAYVARFLKPKAAIVARQDPGEADFREIARFYNGPGYEAHRYHESLARWFREFRLLLA